MYSGAFTLFIQLRLKLFPAEQKCFLFLCKTAYIGDDDFQRRLSQILLQVQSLEDLIIEIQTPKTTTEKEVNEKIKVRNVDEVFDKLSVPLRNTGSARSLC